MTDIDNSPALRLIARMIRATLVFVSLGLFAVLSTFAAAMVGGAPPAEPAIARHVVLIVGSRGTSCTGVAIARDLVLTAGHCALPGADYKLVQFDAAHQPTLKDIATISLHPQFDLNTLLGHRATADVALMKTAQPLPANQAPAPLAANAKQVAVGDRFLVAGFGLTVRGDGKTGGTVRSATLVATGQPGTLQIRLVDPATRGDTAGLGACTADSGAPAFDLSSGQPQVIGLVSWSTGPRNADGCGGLTGVTPLARYRAWIVETAGKLGSPVMP